MVVLFFYDTVLSFAHICLHVSLSLIAVFIDGVHVNRGPIIVPWLVTPICLYGLVNFLMLLLVSLILRFVIILTLPRFISRPYLVIILPHGLILGRIVLKFRYSIFRLRQIVFRRFEFSCFRHIALCPIMLCFVLIRLFLCICIVPALLPFRYFTLIFGMIALL